METVEDKTEVPPTKKTSEEEIPPISPDKGATGETTSSENKEARTQTGLSEEEEEAHYKEEYNNAVFKLLKNIGMQNPELGRDILMESLLKHFAMKIGSKRSEKPDFLEEDGKCARDEEEFETYLTLLKEVRAHGGHNMELLTVQYILEHKGEAYYQNLCMSCSYKEK